MVAPNRKRIYKGETPVQELKQAFNDEIKGIMKAASLKLACPVEELKCRFDNTGKVEVQKMTSVEIKKAESERRLKKRVAMVKRMKGL